MKTEEPPVKRWLFCFVTNCLKIFVVTGALFVAAGSLGEDPASMG